MSHAVLVTGAFGNMGTRVIHALLEAGHRVVALDLQNSRTVAAAAQFSATTRVIWGDICDPAIWDEALQGIDTVVHLASLLPPYTDHDPERTVAVNHTATRELIAHMEASPSAKRLVFASSMILLGPEQHLRTPPVNSYIEPRPSEIYGETKAACERDIRASSLHWSILRFAVCPPVHFSVSEVGRLEAMLHASADGRLEVIHPQDAGLAVANTISCDETIGRILLIGGGDQCQTRALSFYNQLLQTAGLWPLERSQLRPGPPYFFGDWLDTTESQKLLHYQTHTLNDMLAELRRNTRFQRWLLRVVAPLVHTSIKRLARRLHKQRQQAPGAH